MPLLEAISADGTSYSQFRSYLRGIPLQNYIIFYRIANDGIEIMRIIRGDRDLEAFFDEHEE